MDHIVDRECDLESGHRCLAYVFGDISLRYASWTDRHWPSHSLWCLTRLLEQWLRPSSPRNRDTFAGSTHEREFNLLLVQTAVMLLSQRHQRFGLENWCIEFLFAQLCRPESLLSKDEHSNVIHLVLEESALLRIVGILPYFGYDENMVSCGVAILESVLTYIGRLLGDARTLHYGDWLFAKAVFSEPGGTVATWDLGEWIRNRAPEILRLRPSSTAAIQGIHDALTAIYPLCAENDELRALWDRIDYPGRPGDIFTDPFLDLGAFFSSAEEPCVHGDIVVNPS
ncbi:hypothetical protein AURDEDRAFT_149722 [Auricularia subglabra TFB-10046 SS5]|nr:hypothetical protein AURDEDRAFT_149722 [Auricularia subglabra TFB-10046 SS5]